MCDRLCDLLEQKRRKVEDWCIGDRKSRFYSQNPWCKYLCLLLCILFFQDLPFKVGEELQIIKPIEEVI